MTSAIDARVTIPGCSNDAPELFSVRKRETVMAGTGKEE
jgi:hypothetical protein